SGARPVRQAGAHRVVCGADGKRAGARDPAPNRPPHPRALRRVLLRLGLGGRGRPGIVVEAFTILPRHERAAAAIEYKRLSANGVETAWLAAGSVCGTTGRNTPLLGFAVRQKAGVAGARFDCEYSGSFESGAVSGPARNGAPCRSVSDNDPLEGLQLCIIDRS